MLGDRLRMLGPTARQTWTTWDGTYNGSDSRIVANSDTTVSYSSCTLAAGVELVAWNDQTSTKMYAVVVTTTGTSNSYGTVATIASVNTSIALCKLDSGRALCCYGTSGTAFSAVVLSVSGSTITVNTPTSVATGLSNPYCNVTFLSADKCLMTYASDNHSGYANIITTSTTSISAVGAQFNFATDVKNDSSSVSTLTTTTAIVSWQQNSNSRPQVVVLSVSGTTITAPGSQVELEANSRGITNIAALSATEAVCAYISTAGTNLFVCSMTISGTTITAGTPSSVDTLGINTSNQGNSVVALTATQAMVLYQSSSGNFNGMVITTTGTTFSAGSKIAIVAGGTNTDVTGTLIDINRVLAVHTNSANSTAACIVLNIK